MTSSLRFALLVVASTTASGCSVDPAGKGTQPRALDFNYFACNVQPIVVAHCSMSACHGNGAHPLRLYSPGRLRLVADGQPQPATLSERDAPLRNAEARANFAAAQALSSVTDPPEASPLLRKPLAPFLGGGAHAGGIVFRSVDDPRYATLYAWMSGVTQPAGCPALQQFKDHP